MLTAPVENSSTSNVPAGATSSGVVRRSLFRSLRTRLLIALSLIVLVCWSVALAMRLMLSFSDQSVWDRSLRQTANTALASLPSNFDSALADPARLVRSERIAPLKADEKGDLCVQIWVNGQNVVRTPCAPVVPLKPDFVAGFADQHIEGELWRVYDVSDRGGKVHVQVGKSPQQRTDAVLLGAAFFALAALLLLVLPGIAIWWVTRWSFAPIDELRYAIARRKPFDLTPLPTTKMLVEVEPLVDSFNGLLQQLRDAVENERRFITDAAHELRTPLAVLAAQVQVLLHSDTVEEKNVAAIRLAAGVERSARLSEQLLDLARLETAEYSPERSEFDLSELVALIVRDFENFARQRRQTIALEVEQTRMRANIDEIGILLRNLLDNALRYSGEGGHVAISCRHVQHNGTIGAKFSISDDGPGVLVDQRTCIFDRFYRVAGSGVSGSGIGLSLVARVAETYAAKIELGSGLGGRGLGISVWFP